MFIKSLLVERTRATVLMLAAHLPSDILRLILEYALPPPSRISLELRDQMKTLTVCTWTDNLCLQLKHGGLRMRMRVRRIQYTNNRYICHCEADRTCVGKCTCHMIRIIMLNVEPRGLRCIQFAGKLMIGGLAGGSATHANKLLVLDGLFVLEP